MSKISEQLDKLDGETVLIAAEWRGWHNDWTTPNYLCSSSDVAERTQARAGFFGFTYSAEPSYTLSFVDCQRDRLLSGPSELGFRMYRVGDEVVCFESCKYPECYVDMSDNLWLAHDNTIKLNPHRGRGLPRDEPWARFSLHGDDLSDVAIRSERWTELWWCYHSNAHVPVGTKTSNSPPTALKHRFRILNARTGFEWDSSSGGGLENVLPLNGGKWLDGETGAMIGYIS